MLTSSVLQINWNNTQSLNIFVKYFDLFITNFFSMGFVFLLTSPCFKNSPVEFFINSSNITIYCKVFTLHGMSSDLYFVD